MGQISIMLNGGSQDDNSYIFNNICSTIKDKIGPALDENETILFQACPLSNEYELNYEMETTNKILTHKKKGLFRHLKMASSFENLELGTTEKFRIRVDIFFLDHFINIKIFDMIFDLIQERVPNTFEILAIYSPFEKEEKYRGFTPKPNDRFFVLQPATALLPEVVVHKGENYK